ncbi:hypothetical protein D3C72_718820 [compost metagenome]
MQSAYSTNMDAGFEGQVADLTNHDALTYAAEGAIPFGRGVVEGTTPKQVKLPGAASTAAQFRGVTLHSHAVEQDADGVAQYRDKRATSVMTRGRVLVKVEQNVVPGDAVYLRIAANGAGTAAGQFRKDADTDKAVAITKARWTEAIAAGGVGVLEFGL